MSGLTNHGEPFSSRMPASVASLSRLAAVWQEIVTSLQLAQLESQWLFEVELCFVEVVTNAIKYGGQAAPNSTIELRASVAARVLELAVTDHGPGMEDLEGMAQLPDEPLAENGRGLAIVKTLIPDMRCEPCAEGNRVILRRPLPSP